MYPCIYVPAIDGFLNYLFDWSETLSYYINVYEGKFERIRSGGGDGEREGTEITTPRRLLL